MVLEIPRLGEPAQFEPRIVDKTKHNKCDLGLVREGVVNGQLVEMGL